MTYNTDISQFHGEEFLKKGEFKYWVFSFGGCGTNYIRKILNIFKIENRSIINRKNSNLIKAVHLHYPPKIENPKFTAIYVFGDPYLSLNSIFRRRLYKTINILAGEKLYSKKKSVNYKNFINDLEDDLLRFKNKFMNWLNSDTPYPVIFINYSKLNKIRITYICKKIEKDFGIEINYNEIEKFTPRVSKIEKLSKMEIRNLKKIYGIFREYLSELPDFWIKYPNDSNKLDK